MKVLVNSKDLEQSLKKFNKISQLFINDYDKAMINKLDLSLINNTLILQNHCIKTIIDCEVIEKDDRHRVFDIENLFNLIKKYKECKIELSTDIEILTIKEFGKDRQKQINYNFVDNDALNTMSAVDINTLGYFSLKHNDLKEFMKKNKYTFDNQKTNLYNVNLSINDDMTLNLASTNSMILGYMNINNKKNKKFKDYKECNIDKKNIDIIIDVMEDFDKIYFNNTFIYIEEKNTKLIMPTQDTNFPKYREIIPEHNSKERSIVKFNAKELWSNIADVKFDKYIEKIKLHIIDNSCKISSQNDNLENINQISCQSKCDIEITFKDENLKFLSLFKEDTNVEMSIMPNRPVSIINDTSAIKYVVMPIVS